jgi:GDP-L-fucose synthase
MNKTSSIFISGHRGLVGSAICRRLQQEGYNNLILQTRAELDLTQQDAVRTFFVKNRPEYVFCAAAKVGGILANQSYPADFIRDNLLIQSNLIDAAYQNASKKLLFLGSSCIYPKLAPQPMREEHLLTGPLEPTNEWYAIAKIAGIKMVQAYRRQYGFDGICLQPTNLYGPHDNFDLQTSHVLPALLRKLHEAKQNQSPQITVWGTGTPRREFLHVDDLADACVFAMQNYQSEEILNVGLGEDISIRELAQKIAHVVGYQGELIFDSTKPDGAPRKLLDCSRIHSLGWRAQTSLEQGLRTTYEWYCANIG